MRFKEFLKELLVKNYVRPACKDEYSEIIKYQQFAGYSLTDWLKVARLGKAVKFSTISKVGNADATDIDSARRQWNMLDAETKDKLIKDKSPVEMPVVLKSNNDYDLLSNGNKLTSLLAQGYDPMVWVVEL